MYIFFIFFSDVRALFKKVTTRLLATYSLFTLGALQLRFARASTATARGLNEFQGSGEVKSQMCSDPIMNV